jgi:hypothetical protein
VFELHSFDYRIIIFSVFIPDIDDLVGQPPKPVLDLMRCNGADKESNNIDVQACRAQQLAPEDTVTDHAWTSFCRSRITNADSQQFTSTHGRTLVSSTAMQRDGIYYGLAGCMPEVFCYHYMQRSVVP